MPLPIRNGGSQSAILAALLLSGCSGGDWADARIEDPITDKVTYNSSVGSLPHNGQPARTATLELSCQVGERIGLVIEAGRRMGGSTNEDNYVQRMVRFRLDKGPVNDTVGVIGDHFIGFTGKESGKGSWDDPIIGALRNASRLAIETETVRGEPVQLLFNVTGADETIERLERGCRVKR